MITFKVNLKPVTQGSVHAITVRRKDGSSKPVVVHNKSNELYEQRAIIQSEYQKAGGQFYEKEPISLVLSFSFIRPKSVSEKKRPYHTVKPDLDKLIRAVLDSLTNVAYKDDCQVVRIDAEKMYSDEEYIMISVYTA